MHRARHLSLVRKSDLAQASTYETHRQSLRHLDEPGSSAAQTDDALAAEQKRQAHKAFLSLLSHELRTPLNSVIGFSEVLSYELYGPLGAPQYVEYAHLIRDSGFQILNLVKNALDLVRLENGHAELDVKSRLIAPVLSEFVTRFSDETRERGIRLEIIQNDETLSAMCDDYALHACLDQLMLNALDYTLAGHIISVEAVAAGDKVLISLFNPGKAPHPREIERLMRPFEKGDEVRHTLKGSGLGWPIVRHSMKAMGGRFDVDSDPRKGLKAIMSLQNGG